MKKIVVLLLAFCVALTACGNAADQNSNEPISTTTPASREAVVAVNPVSNAVYLCQFVKDCLAEPDSFQIHGISHIEEEGQNYYYLDFSHMVKNRERERTYYYSQFDGDTLLCIVNENSAIYYQTEGDYTVKYLGISDMFQKQGAQILDAAWIFSRLK